MYIVLLNLVLLCLFVVVVVRRSFCLFVFLCSCVLFPSLFLFVLLLLPFFWGGGRGGGLFCLLLLFCSFCSGP